MLVSSKTIRRVMGGHSSNASVSHRATNVFLNDFLISGSILEGVRALILDSESEAYQTRVASMIDIPPLRLFS
jgi:hypothetical protein